MKIGVFGGTFNPPHLGHTNVIESVFEHICLDKILVVPNKIPVHKKLPTMTATTSQRLDMCEIAFSHIYNVEISQIEILRETKSFMINTLKSLQNADDELFLIIGTDSFLNIEKWHDFEEIFKICTLVVINRFDVTQNAQFNAYLTAKYNAKTILIPSKLVDVSSSEVRDYAETILMDTRVLKYIKDNKIYEK